jgi:hypothetical protein
VEIPVTFFGPGAEYHPAQPPDFLAQGLDLGIVRPRRRKTDGKKKQK